MWELRLVWSCGKPGWWDATWAKGAELLGREQRKPEPRPDLYLVLPERVDVGLKLRGGAEGDFDAKVLHARAGGWELWEKVAYFKWDALEAARFAAMIRVTGSSAEPASNATPTRGAKGVLEAAGMKSVDVKVEKRRMQSAAGDLLCAVTAHSANASCLAELVEIHLPQRREPLFSLCLETMDPLRSGVEAFPGDGALCCGYPELLSKHVRGAL